MHADYLLSHRRSSSFPLAVEETEAGGAADRDRNWLTGKVPTAAMPTDALYIPARDGGLGAPASGGGDKVHGQDYTRRERRGAHEPGREAADSSDGTIQSNY